MVAWVVLYDILILLPLFAERGPNTVRTSGFAMAFFFLVLGVLVGVFGKPILTSAFVIWFTISLLPLFRLVSLSRRKQEIPWHLSLVVVPGILLAANVGVVFELLVEFQ